MANRTPLYSESPLKTGDLTHSLNPFRQKSDTAIEAAETRDLRVDFPVLFFTSG
jgi:hypothetical protein